MTTEIKKNQVVVFSDITGRMLIGSFQEITEGRVVINDPHLVNANDQGDGKLAINFIPYTYLELFDAKSEGSWSFPESSVTITSIAPSQATVQLYQKIVVMYKQSRIDMVESQPQAPEVDNVIKMTD